MSGGREFAVAGTGGTRVSMEGLDDGDARDLLRSIGYECKRCGPAFNCKACAGGDAPPSEGSNADPEQVADLADRSAFTCEQIRDMSARERELLDRTLAEQADDDGGDSGTDDDESPREEVETLRDERQEARREAVAADEGLTGSVGVLTTLSNEDRERGDDGAVGVLAALSEREDGRPTEAHVGALSALSEDETEEPGVGALATLSAREAARESGEADAGADGGDGAASAYAESVGALSSRESDESGDTER